MGVRCSLLGCEYEETHIERDREERGDEVILTVREYKECTRCGGVELISENTGVTAVADADRSDVDEEADRAEAAAVDSDVGTAGADPADGPSVGSAEGPSVERLAAAAQATDAPDEATTAAPSASTPADGGPAVEASTESAGAADPGEATDPDVQDDAVVVDGSGEGFESGFDDDDGPETATGDGSTADESTAEETAVEDPADAIRRVGTDDDPEDDAVILTDSESDPAEAGAPGVGVDDADGIGGYDVGESGWPDHDDHGRQEAGATGTSQDAGAGAGGDWPTHDDRDDRDDHGRRDADGATGTGAGGDSPGSSGDPSGGRGGVAVAQAASEARGRGVDHDRGHDATRSDADRTADAGAETDGDGATAGPQLRCPGCGHSVERSGTPHRAGDICPSCSRAYLDER